MATATGEPMKATPVEPGAREREINEGIRRTREDMSRTVDEIEQRLSPAHIKEQVRDVKESMLGEYHEVKDHLKDDIRRELREAKESAERELRDIKFKLQQEVHEARVAVHDATVGRVENMVHDARDTVTDAGHTVMDTVKANPVPAALVALGVGWLLMSGSRGRSRRAPRERQMRSRDYGYGYGMERNEYGYPRDVEGRVANAGHRVQETASKVVDQAAGVARDAGAKVAEVAHDARDAAVHFAEDARVRGTELVKTTGQSIYRAEQSFEGMMRENPLAFGAVALAIGAAIGLALPHTEKEDEWMGETKERLLHRAEGLASEAIHGIEQKVTKSVERLGAADDKGNEVKGHNGARNGKPVEQKPDKPSTV